MQSLAPIFNRQQATFRGISLFWLLVWAVAIDDDRQRRERERRRKDWIAGQAQQRRELKRRLPALRPF